MSLNISTIPTVAPYIFIEDDVIVFPNTQPKTIADGIEVEIFREYGNRFNITLNFTIDTRYWGGLFENRSGNGLYGSVTENKHNAAIGGCIFWSKAAEYIEYANAAIDVHTICLVPAPRYIDKFLLVLVPFTLYLWIIIICTILLLTMVLSYLIPENTPKLGQRHKKKSAWIRRDHQRNTSKRLKEIFNNVFNVFSNSLFTIYYLTLLQPLPETLLAKSKFILRFIFAISLMQALLISTAYISGLSAILAIPRYEPPIRTLQDLIDSKMEWGANDVSWVVSIMNSNDTKINTLLKTFKVYDDETLKRLPHRTYAYVTDELSDGSYSIPPYLPENGYKLFQLMDQEILYADYRAIFRKSSPFLLEYNKLVQRFRESGLVPQIIELIKYKHSHLPTKFVLYKRERKSIEEHTNPVPLGIYDLESIFLIWGLGIITSCVIFGLEKYIDSHGS